MSLFDARQCDSTAEIHNSYCAYIHKLFNGMERYGFPFQKDKIPPNGICIFFEKGEIAHSVDKIVMISTHNGDHNLFNRLEEHFVKEKKDRSIFRKNIGRAILNKNGDDFLEYWNIDLTTRRAREKYSNIIDIKKQKEVEEEVTKHIQDNITFVVLRVDEKKTRLELKSKIITTVSLCAECKPSERWLGNYSPKEKIKESGLWLEQGLPGKIQLNDKDIEYRIYRTLRAYSQRR